MTVNYESVVESEIEHQIANRENDDASNIAEAVWEALVEYAMENDERLLDADGELDPKAMEWCEDTNHPVGQALHDAWVGAEDSAKETLNELAYFTSVGGWEVYYGVSRYD